MGFAWARITITEHESRRPSKWCGEGLGPLPPNSPPPQSGKPGSVLFGPAWSVLAGFLGCVGVLLGEEQVLLTPWTMIPDTSTQRDAPLPLRARQRSAVGPHSLGLTPVSPQTFKLPSKSARWKEPSLTTTDDFMMQVARLSVYPPRPQRWVSVVLIGLLAAGLSTKLTSGPHLHAGGSGCAIAHPCNPARPFICCARSPAHSGVWHYC